MTGLDMVKILELIGNITLRYTHTQSIMNQLPNSSISPISEQVLHIDTSSSSSDAASTTATDSGSQVKEVEDQCEIEQNKLFVAKLPGRIDERRLRGMFQSFGKIIDCEVIRNKQYPHRSLGYGFVTFEHGEPVDEIISIHRTQSSFSFTDRPLDLDYARSDFKRKQLMSNKDAQPISRPIVRKFFKEEYNNTPKRPVDKNKAKTMRDDRLYVSGIPLCLTEDDLYQHFARFGALVNINMCEDKQPGKPMHAFITFNNRDNCDYALRSGPHEVRDSETNMVYHVHCERAFRKAPWNKGPSNASSMFNHDCNLNQVSMLTMQNQWNQEYQQLALMEAIAQSYGWPSAQALNDHLMSVQATIMSPTFVTSP